MPPPASNPASSSAPTVTTSTSATLPPNLKRKYDEIVDASVGPGSTTSKKRRRVALELERQEQGIAAFDKLFSVAPELLEVVKLLYLEASDKPKHGTDWCSCATTDTSGLKHKLDYFLPNPRKNVLRPPIPEQESKSDRGLDRSKLPPLIITPPKSSHSLPAADGSPNATSSSDDAADAASTSNAFLKRIVENKNLDQGLLRGEVIPRVLRHVWTGPKSGIDGSSDGLPKGCNALAHNTVRVSPEMIGYGACQARTMLATKDWAERDGEYDYNELFTKIVNLSADPDDPWAKETLDWYQDQVVGNAAANIPQAGSDDESDEKEDIMTQRAARRGPPRRVHSLPRADNAALMILLTTAR
ncbi:hypothetical protein B0H19DRAFT_1265231 [Mycena capillaripes]|nr:hypothetical protein B0H19DRAFT_1265231 [Mycena capillaripes]